MIDRGDWKNGVWLVFDTETTGVNVDLGDKVVELGAVLMQRGTVIEKRSGLVDPGMPIPPQASDVHGIYDEDVAGAKTLAEITPSFIAMIEKADIMVAYNAPFDIGFLDAGCPGFKETRAGVPMIDPLVVVRTPKVGKYWKGAGRHRLTSVCERLHIPVAVNAHRASADAIMTGLLLWQLKEKLPSATSEVVRFIERERKSQDRDFKAWKRKMEKRKNG